MYEMRLSLAPGIPLPRAGTCMDRGPATQESAKPPTAPVLAIETAATHRRGRTTKLRVPASWPLLAILAVQAALSLRLVRADTAFEDEATYLWAGHLEWAHWLHGTPLPQFPAYFSGAPGLYPPIGALADSIGGLTGARVLSLIFMLVATTFLWGTVSKLYGNRAAFFAAALFAVSGPTLHLGAFATYDAMSVFLIAFASWCVVRPKEGQEATGWMVVAAVALAVANATAYSTLLFDPIVVLLAVFTAFPKPGGKIAARRVAIFVIIVAVLLLAGLLIGGGSYLGGLERTTLARGSGGASPLTVLTGAWSWSGLIIGP